MISTKGIYHKGELKLDEPVNSDKPLKVIVTFLEETDEIKDEDKPLSLDDFSFAEARKLTAHLKGNWSEDIVEDRRNAKY